jgi:hypothetical protein
MRSFEGMEARQQSKRADVPFSNEAPTYATGKVRCDCKVKRSYSKLCSGASLWCSCTHVMEWNPFLDV